MIFLYKICSQCIFNLYSECLLFYFILFYFILFYFILFYFILFYFILFYSILFYSILFYSILFYSILFYSILFYSILFYSILFYSILFFLFYSILFSSISGLCSCSEKIKWNMATQSYDCVIMNWHYSCSLDFANILWVMWSMAVISKVTSFNSCISNMLCHYSPVVILCFDAVYLHISAIFFISSFKLYHFLSSFVIPTNDTVCLLQLPW